MWIGAKAVKAGTGDDKTGFAGVASIDGVVAMFGVANTGLVFAIFAVAPAGGDVGAPEKFALLSQPAGETTAANRATFANISLSFCMCASPRLLSLYLRFL